MERWLPWLAVVALTVVSAGCGGKIETPTIENSAAAGGDAAAAAANVPPPEAAVAEFLNAVKRGDDEKSAQMLTPLARQKTAELDMIVAPPGSDTATFKVGDVEMVETEVAHVACTWTDVGEDGKPREEKIIWMLRREPDGWRIAGMATELFEGELPLLLDFENPQDMLEKERMAQEEILRRQQAAGAVPVDPTQPVQPAAAAEAMKQAGPAAPVRQ